MNLTVFAGTFNPIHIAHLIIAESVRTELNADKILFIPSFIPPHRDSDLAGAAHRLNMVKLAIETNPHFEVSDIELKLQGISYTFNTIQELYRQNSEIKSKINFIIGADAFNNIESWYKYEELAKLINFIVLARPKSKDIEEIINNLSLKDFSYKFVEAPRIDISSSFIRQRVKEKKSVKHLVTNEVESYIEKNRLYCD
ncbi:MAG: nicotinate (nicotinamide) nucleotide adenylyltransferase [bacterium]